VTPFETLLARPGDTPTLADLGGEDAVWQQSDALSTSRLWFRIAEVLLSEWDTLAHPDLAADLITRALASTDSPAAADDVLDLLCVHPGYLEHAADRLNALVLDRSRRCDSPLDAELAGICLEAALRLALPGTTRRYGLLDRLVDPAAPSTRPAYARRVVRALGAGYEQWRESDLRTALEPFLDTTVHSDAAFELAMCHLADAFNAPDRATLLHAFTEAQTLLRHAVDADEERPDASAYLAALDAILAFDTGQTEDLRDAAERLRRCIAEHTLWLTGTRTQWRDGRYDTEAAWYTLSNDLEHIDAHLDQPFTTWASRTTQHLLAAYTAHRAVGIGSQDAPGIQLLIAPRIEEAFARREGLLLHLRAVLADAPPEWERDAANELLATVNAQLDPTAQPPDGPGKAAPASHHPWAAILGERVLAALPEQILSGLQALTDDEADTLARLPIAQQEIFNDVLTVLRHCPDFTGSVRQGLVRLVTQGIRFLHSRTNRGRAHHTSRCEYLFAPPAGSALPLENTVQEDLQDYLDGNLDDVDIELPDRSGGRADIIVRYPGFEIVIECKRTTGKTTQAGLSRYLGQTVAYQAGGVALGMLVVLDLTPKRTWIPSIRDNMWAQRVPAPSADLRDRWAVIVRVPGNRITPHDM